jgi:hypothetical protein
LGALIALTASELYTSSTLSDCAPADSAAAATARTTRNLRHVGKGIAIIFAFSGPFETSRGGALLAPTSDGPGVRL